VAAADPLDAEVATVERHHAARAELFGHRNEGSVGEVDGVVGPFVHQLERSRDGLVVHEPNPHPSRADKLAQRGGAATARRERLKRVRQDGYRRDEFAALAPERRAAPIVIGIARIEQGDQRPGIDEGHRLCFRRIDLRTDSLERDAGPVV